ncbi:protoporphyrinogen oxidase [Streptomyces zingiberis]|uniref:Coproporphyrinogen III oxidase n=1 Tax=Streptomyces zingiberis TaxID=2053010 RepID=A0ABX1BVG4_9ACTN|nr:protoporphyrinogen oxidase [Streptomyces zingiberis]NJQ01058.1 protoporphyrinogen oxidase [Streptomyces zingiberis]
MSETDDGTGAGTGRGPAAGGAGRGGHVVVVGGGIAGLAAAHRLLAGGARVTLLEASPRLGGKLLAGELAGVPVDFGAESLLARRPEAIGLARAVGLAERLQAPATATAALWTRGALRPLPTGHVMGVPGDMAALAASGVLSPEGLERARREPELPVRPLPAGSNRSGTPGTPGGPGGAVPGEGREGRDGGEGEDPDVAVGAYVAERFGREVVDRLVEPLLGGVYAGDAYRLSLRAAVPQLYGAAREGRMLTGAVQELRRRSGAATGPVFLGIEGGVGTLPEAVAAACRAGGAEIVTGAAVRELRRAGAGWRLVAEGPGAGEAGAAAARAGAAVTRRSVLTADAVVLAVPAAAAARLLAGPAPAAAAELNTVEYASMALVSMAFRRADLGGPDALAGPAGPTSLAGPAGPAPGARGSGFLVPAVEGRAIKAATFASRKWGWIGAAAPELFVIRTSVGRHGEESELKRDDAGLVEVSLRDLGEATGLRARPVGTRVTRWRDGLPQYPVGHTGRVARIRAALADLPGLRVCGAAYDGVGIPACVAGGTAAAEDVLGGLATLAPGTAPGEGE